MTTDMAWAAGLFEGEGSIFPSSSGQIYLSITMTDKDVVDRFASIVGCGRIEAPFMPTSPSGGQTKMAYKWKATRHSEAVRVLASLYPFLGARRKARADELIALYDAGNHRGYSGWDGQTHCSRGHELTAANIYVAPDGSRSCRPCRNGWRKRVA